MVNCCSAIVASLYGSIAQGVYDKIKKYAKNFVALNFLYVS